MNNTCDCKKTTIYQFEIYDAQNDEIKKSSRWGTRYAIETIAHGKVLEDSAFEIDESEVDTDIPGMTEKNFVPHHHYNTSKVTSQS